MTEWIDFDHERPTKAGVYEWWHKHNLGFEQRFFARMRLRGSGFQSRVLSPDFDHWNGHHVCVPNGFKWRIPDDPIFAAVAEKRRYVILDINLRNCPFCAKRPTIKASQCGWPGGGDGVVICAKPQNYNTWRVEQCCRLIGFNGFKSPFELAAAWNAERTDQ